MNPLILDGVTALIGGRPLFPPLTLRVEPGVVTSVMGESGAGKSTLLAHLCGALPSIFQPLGQVRLGELVLDGQRPEDRRLGILFQDDLLFPHLSVGHNVAFGMSPSAHGRGERRRAVALALESVGLAGFAERDPATLSGGQRARVALLRVLLSEPRALLLDEPFGRLDGATRAPVRDWVFDEVRRRGLPTLLVTHDADDVRAAAGPMVEIRPREGH